MHNPEGLKDMVEDENTGMCKWVALIISAITSSVITFMMSAVNVAVPRIGDDFQMEAVLLGWVVTAMTLPQAVLLLPFGRIADIYGRKKIFIYGMVLFIVSTFLCAIASSGVMLVVFRFFQGISGGMVFGISTAIVTSIFPSNERGRALGISMAASFIGLTAGPFIGGGLTQPPRWRSIFYFSFRLRFCHADENSPRKFFDNVVVYFLKYSFCFIFPVSFIVENGFI